MTLTPQLQKAIDTAALLHKDHVRIGDKGIPYISHLIHVLAIVSTYTEREEVLIAALLHDTIEDVPEYTLSILEQDFGREVRIIVESLSEIREFETGLSERDRWIHAKKSYLTKIALAGTDAHIISAADKIHNMSCIVEGITKGDQSLTRRFEGQALLGQVWFTEEVYKIIESTLPDGLRLQYQRIHAELKALLPETK